MFLFAMIVYVTRIVVRARAYGQFGSDDVMITVAAVSVMTSTTNRH
jgi:hypothetical protein